MAKCLVLFLLVFCVCFFWVLCAESSDEREEADKRDRCPKLTDEEYRLILQLLIRSSPIPVSTRTGEQNKAYKKISKYHLKRKIVAEPYAGALKRDRVIINGKIILPTSEIESTVKKFYKATKGDGARKLNYRMKEYYYGIGERLIQSYINNWEQQTKRRPRFENKAPLQPVRAQSIMDRHQIDLVDMKSFVVKEGAKTYRYILSILDVFSRFVWLRALENKNANTVSEKLYKIYRDFGCPRIVQCDQGSEFKGSVKDICNQLNVKLIYSSSNHPQSQGKVERSHATWKDKIRHDLMSTIEGGVCDWRKSLPALQTIYNEAVHTSIGISPYECLFGKKSNNMLLQVSDTQDDDTMNENKDNNEGELLLVEVRRHLDILSDLRNKAKKTSEKKSVKMTQRSLSKSPPSEYNIGEEVFIKFTGKDKRLVRAGGTISAPKVLEGKIIGRNMKLFRYKVQVRDSNGKVLSKWYKVNNITSKTQYDERQKRAAAKHKTNMNEKRAFRAGLHKFSNRDLMTKSNKRQIDEINYDRRSKEFQILYELVCRLQKEASIESFNNEEMRLSSLEDNALRERLQVAEDNPGGGNCMFYALAQQLHLCGISRTHLQLRREIVQYLRETPVLQGTDGQINLQNFIHGFQSWDDYLNAMAHDGEWGDNVILIAVANRFQTGIRIVTSLPNHDSVMITPVSRVCTNTLNLGHISELHYVSLVPITVEVEELCPSCGVLNTDTVCMCADTKYICDCCGRFHSLHGQCEENADSNDFTTIEEVVVMPQENEDLFCQTRQDLILVDITDKLLEWLNPRVNHGNCQKNSNILLAHCKNSAMFNFFLAKCGIELEIITNDDESFYHMDNTLMDIYDDFRKELKRQVNAVMTGFVLIFITTQVRQWIRSLSRRLSNALSYQASLILLREDDYVEMLEFIDRQQQHRHDSNDDTDATSYMEE